MFAGYRYVVPNGRSTCQYRFDDLGPVYNHIATEIQAGPDLAAGQISWELTAIDRTTGEEPLNPILGFLLPNDPLTHVGEGSVTFTIRAKPDVPTGTEIRAKATIIFDNNEPIDTNEVFNTIDADPPVSKVAPLAETDTKDPSISLSWSGKDVAGGSGLADYTICVSTDGGPYMAWLANTTDTAGTFAARPGHTYGFSSCARDNAGNVEGYPQTPDATIHVTAKAGDLDLDGTVGASDFQMFRQAFSHHSGEAGYSDAADYDHDGSVTFVDYQIWMAAYRQAINNPLAPPPGPLVDDVPLRHGQGDANGDGYINVGDLQILVRAWGASPGSSGYNSLADFNDDGCVNIGDLQVLVVFFGK